MKATFLSKVGKTSSILASSDDKFYTHDRESFFLTVRGQFKGLFPKIVKGEVDYSLAKCGRVWCNTYTRPVPAANTLQLQSNRRTRGITN